MNLRREAQGKACLVRLPGLCNHDSQTTVLAHYRLPGYSGLGVKSPDLLGAWSCSACHAYIDTHHDDLTRLAHAEACLRTIAELSKRGKVK